MSARDNPNLSIRVASVILIYVLVIQCAFVELLVTVLQKLGIKKRRYDINSKGFERKQFQLEKFYTLLF